MNQLTTANETGRSFLRNRKREKEREKTAKLGLNQDET